MPPVLLNAEPQPGVQGHRTCDIITSSGYVGSITAKQFQASNDRLDEEIPQFAADHGGIRPIATKGWAPGIPPPGTPTTYPRLPYKRIIPKNPYKCAIGSVIVRRQSGAPKPTDLIVLVVTSLVWNNSTAAYVEDTYQLPGAGLQDVTFANVVVQTVYIRDGADGNTDLAQFKQRAPNGTLVGYHTFFKGVGGTRLPCVVKPEKNLQGPGKVTCAAGTPWPLP